MLSSEQAIVVYEGGRAHPDRLTARTHHRYLLHAERLLGVYRGGAGRTRRELHRAVDVILSDEPDCDPRRIRALSKLLDDASRFAWDPEERAADLRLRVFDLAAPHHPLVETSDGLFDTTELAAKTRIAAELGRPWAEIEAALFADFPDFQRLEAFGSLTVRDNVRVAFDIHRGLTGLVRPSAANVDALLERVGIAAYARERADAIPTGTARLLELARCLAADPQLLLLDEPSSGLDEAETDAFGELLAGLAAEGRGILMVEHDMDLVMAVCDEIHVLDFGEVIATGSPVDIRGDKRVQEAYLGYSDPDPDPVLTDLTQELPAVKEAVR